jgi:hemolysin III
VSAYPKLRGAAAEPVRTKPLLRGVSHQVAFFAALLPLGWLLGRARPGLATVAAAVYGGSLLLLLGTSALYHRVHWRPAARALVKRLDHSAIFVLIAGTYTPIFLLAVGGQLGSGLCLTLWLGALLGIAQTLGWPAAPRWLHVGIYVVLGWIGALGLAAELRSIGLWGMTYHVLGGVLYTVGAIVYARRRPDPYPTVFGYHEVFHLLVIVACGCLFQVVRLSLLAFG